MQHTIARIRGHARTKQRSVWQPKHDRRGGAQQASRGEVGHEDRNMVTKGIAGQWSVVGRPILRLRYGAWALAAKATDTVALAAMPRGPRELAIKSGAATLTQYRGIHLLHRFLSRIGFKDAPTIRIRATQRNNRYSIGEMVSTLPYPMIRGLGRIEITRLLRQNGRFQHITGLPRYFDSTTRRRLLPWR